MRTFAPLGSAGLALTLVLAACGQSSTPSVTTPGRFTAETSQHFVAGQLVVGLAEGQSASDAAKLVGGRVLTEIPRLSAVLIGLPSDLAVEKAVRIFAGAGTYRYAEPNYINTRPIDLRATNAAPAAPTLSAQDVKLNDPQIGRQWFLANMNAPKAWETATGKGVRIGIADEDIDRGHPDLRDNMVFPGYDAPENKLITSDTPYDKFGDHGTVVAGTAAAVGNNGKGGAGVAYRASIIPLTITHSAGASNVDSANAFIFGVVGPDGKAPGTPGDTDTPAGRNGYVDIINYSFGGSAYSQLSKEAIDFVLLNKVVFVTSAGNTPTTGPASPAWLPGVISVAASTPRNERTSFSNRGAHLTVAAPGENIWVTSVRSNVEDPNEVSYQYINGTSFSSPATAGTAALILEQSAEKDANGNITKITLTPAQVRRILEDTAFKPTGAYNIDTGNGVVRADAAVTRAGQNAAATVEKGATVQMKFVAQSDASVGVPLVGVALAGGKRPGQFLYGQSAAGNALFPTGVVTFAEVDAGTYRIFASGPRTVIAGGTAAALSGSIELEAGKTLSLGAVPLAVELPTDNAEPNNTLATATATGYGKVVNGVLNLGDVDLFGFTGAQDDTVFVNAQTVGGSPNLKVSLLNAAGTVIATNSSQRTGVTDAALTFKLTAAGQYFVRVESENVGNPFNTYWMSLGRLVGTETEPNGSVTANGETLTNLNPTGANPLGIGEARDASLATETDTDVYTFEGTKGQIIVADVNATVSGQPDGLLALFRQGVAEPLRVVDDTNTQDPTIEFEIQETGTYYLVFVPYTTSTQKSKGDYRISLSAY